MGICFGKKTSKETKVATNQLLRFKEKESNSDEVDDYITVDLQHETFIDSDSETTMNDTSSDLESIDGSSHSDSKNSLRWSNESSKEGKSHTTEPVRQFPHPLLGQVGQGSSEFISESTREIRLDPGKANQPSYSPKLLKSVIPPHMKLNFHREKSSSTSTLFMNSTIKAPDNDEILKCMSLALYWNIKKYEEAPKKKLNDVFSEEIYPLNDDADPDTLPTKNSIYEFLSTVFETEQLSAECGVMTMAYIDRLLTLTGLSMVSSNWRRIVVGCLILASKVWEDQAVWNVDFVDVFSKVTVKDLNQLERYVLNGLQFNVGLKASVYAKFYFELRSFSERDSKHFPLKPLDKEGAKRMEQRSHGIEEDVRKVKITRSQSVDGWVTKPAQVSLS